MCEGGVVCGDHGAEEVGDREEFEKWFDVEEGWIVLKMAERITEMMVFVCYF